jgi:hypothetical protein
VPGLVVEAIEVALVKEDRLAGELAAQACQHLGAERVVPEGDHRLGVLPATTGGPTRDSHRAQTSPSETMLRGGHCERCEEMSIARAWARTDGLAFGAGVADGRDLGDEPAAEGGRQGGHERVQLVKALVAKHRAVDSHSS